MKELWVKIDETVPKNLRDSLLELAAKLCDAAYVDKQFLADAEKAGVKTAADSGKCNIQVLEEFDQQKVKELKASGKKVAIRVAIKGKEDEEKAVKAAGFSPEYIIIHCLDWKIIPLENLIAKARGKSKLIAEVSSAEDARLAIETLELGVDGVLLTTSDPKELMKASYVLKKQKPKIELTPIKIVDVKRIGTGARACIDTCDLMTMGEGLLLGCQSACLFLVEAEVHENPFVQPRPFRVNAGAISLYALCSLDKTRYLSELKTGDEVLIVDRNGNARLTNIGRVKIEWRPLVLVEAEHEGRRFKIILQNAETIRLVSQEGSIPVTNLKVGDTVLANLTEGGRHFGTLVKEENVVEL
ncbi:MAG: 3-dehydroquinate synthase II [Nitrososphaerota archaeon]|nr:3-dehydroquinate synthase II [Candidatus Bathyarchaeota archaeon]MDW8022289.1 3-dehydroquinate synthase II [Nitrososphaerota archaeon]